MILIRNFLRDTRGATAVEYALILTGIGIIGLASLPVLSTAINAVFGKATNAIG